MQLQDLKSQLTLVFPVRIDCEERRENLRVVLRQLDGLGCRMLVLEADAVLRLMNCDLKSVSYLSSQQEYRGRCFYGFSSHAVYQ